VELATLLVFDIAGLCSCLDRPLRSASPYLLLVSISLYVVNVKAPRN